MSLRIAINGFGRIGRHALKVALKRSDVEVVAINDLTNARVLAHLLKYDSVYGVYGDPIEVEEDGRRVGTEGKTIQEDHFNVSNINKSYLVVAGKKIKVLSEKDPEKLPWGKLKIDVVLECTGRLTGDGSAAAHLEAGAKKVIVSAPTKGGSVPTFLLGVNSEEYSGQKVISNASCTTNCISPIARIIQTKFGITKAMMTTIHAYTAEQNLVDGVPRELHPDLRRGRAAAFNIVPTTTGAAVSTTEAIPGLRGLFDGLAIRVPVICGSLSDLTFLLKKKVKVEEVNQAFIEAENSPVYKGIIGVSYEPLVSSDIIGSVYSAVVDLTLTKVVDGDLLKVMAWYDNEWGYSNRLIEMALLLVKQAGSGD